MTQARRDSHSTEFGLWLREQKEIDSSLGFVASNIDYLWRNYKNGEWMLIEEKRYGGLVKPYQLELFRILDAACKHDINYKGFHVIKFTNTSPEDGKIILDGTEITKQQLLAFLRFEFDKLPV
jgi:hypothetical protein